MEKQNERRSFLKYLFFLSAFIAGGTLSFSKNKGFKTGKINPTEVLGMGVTGKKVKKIAVEEHIGGQELEDLETRLKDMDEAGIDMQVMSCMGMGNIQGATKAEIVALYKRMNENLSKKVEKYPERFAGYTSLPMQDPDAEAKELERTVKELGLKGPFIYTGQDSYFDDKKFWGIYETAEKLDMPVYLHPGAPSSEMSKLCSPYPILAGSMWGFSISTSIHAMRLILSGVFDKYPNLKIMLGHLGEGIPYWLWRMDNRWSKEKETDMYKSDIIELKKKPSQYFKENFYIATSGMFWHPVLDFVKSVLGVDRILFATDYPPESALESTQFIDSIPMSAEDKEKICHVNAEKLLRI